MYTILADGELLYSPSLANEDKSYAAINPRLSLELNKAGNLSFMILPGNRKYEDIQILKTIITVEQDGIEIFRGRVTDITTDIFLQKTVYTEGELAFLLDSIQRPYEYEGAVQALFSMLINQHNAQVDEEKRFVVGDITAVSTEESTHVKVSDYSDTFTEISSRLLDVYGGYLKIRVEGETRYIDYVSDYGTDSAQSVSFGVNMVSMDAGGNSADIFTVLIPLGAAVKGEGGEMKPLDITSVNGGLDYIEDAEGIAQHGRIVRTYTWSHIDDPAKLIEKGREYLAFGITENSTLTIRAVDMHLLDGSIDAIRMGGYVNIQAAPHGITRPEICARIDYDLINPENTVYTFGLPKKSLTDNVVQVIKKVGGGGGGGMGTGLEEEILWLERWAEVYVDENEAIYEILTGQIDNITGRVSTAEILLDGVEANITLLAQEYNELDASLKDCYSLIEVNKDNIELHSQTIEGLNKDLTSANLRIDGVEGSIESVTEKQTEIDGEFTTLKSSITQNAGNITLLSEKYTGLDADVKECYSLIEVNTDSINLHSESINTLTGDLTSANLRIDGVEGSIESVTEKQTEIDGEFTTLKSSITQNAGNITLLSEKYTGLDADVKECYSLIEVNTDSINLHSESINALNGSMTSANLRIDGVEGSIESVTEKQTEIDGEFTTLKSSITQNAGNITLLSEKYTGLDADVKECYSLIEVNTDSINLHSESINALNGSMTSANLRIDGVEGSITTLTEKQEEIDGELVTMQSSITQNAESIESKVSKGSVISSINQSAEAVTISASKINLSGYVTASEFNATISSLWDAEITYIDAATINAGSTSTTFLSANSFTLANNSVKIGTLSMGSLVNEKVLSTSTSVDLAHSHAVTVSDDGTVTLGEVSATGGNFRIADTKTYKDGVSAAKQSVREGVVLANTTGWQNGIFTVSALKANGQTYAVSLPAFSVSGGTSFTPDHKTTVYFSTPSVSGYLDSATVDASSVYAQGYADGGGGTPDITLEASGWARNINTVSAYSGDTLLTKLPVSPPELTYSVGQFESDHTANVKVFSEASVFPALDFDIDGSGVYENGYTAGEDSVTLSASGWSEGHNTVSATNGQQKTITLPEFTVAGGTSFDSNHTSTVHFKTESVSQPLKSVTVDASSVYAEGYNAGWAAARAEVRRTTNSAGTEVYIYGPSATVDASARFYTVGLNVSIPSHTNVSGKITAEASASVLINSSSAITKTASSTIYAVSEV